MSIFIIGFIFIFLCGSLFHFVYDISNHNKIVSLFAAVNESTWEHIKMALTPFLIWSLVDGYILGSNPNYFFAKFVGAISIIVLIPILFYGYKSITKKSILFIDIFIFFISILLGQYFSYLIINMSEVSYLIKYLSVIGLLIIFGIYFIGTIFPIKTIIFKDPITNKYGVAGHSEIFSKKNKKS